MIKGFQKKNSAMEILQGYVLTESMGIDVSMNSIKKSRPYGTVGLLSFNSEAMIVDWCLLLALLIFIFLNNNFSWPMGCLGHSLAQPMGYKGRAKKLDYINGPYSTQPIYWTK